MTYNNLPPQAYTRDDVTKAYLWIQTQPESIRKQATSKEMLVALFLKAKRNGSVSGDQLAPVSSKNFKKDLENLAQEMEIFEKTEGGTDASTKIEPASYTHKAAPSVTDELPEAPIKKTLAAPEAEQVQQTVQEFQKPISIDRTLPSQENKNMSLQLDPRSEQIIRSVKAQLNMESEKDIIRMLLVLGYDRIKTIFPNK